jgi:hypothetical protein
MPPPPPSMPPMPPMAGAQKNDTAMYAMIAGILSVTLCFLFAGIPAIILGSSGKKKAALMGGEGEGQAKAGFILGWISVALSILGIILWVTLFALAVGPFKDEVKKSIISNNHSSYNYDKYGDTVSSSDYDISSEDWSVDDSGIVTYSAYIENQESVDNNYKVSIYCSGSEGDSDTYNAYVNVNSGEEKSFDAKFYFDFDTSYADCNVDEVTYGY